MDDQNSVSGPATATPGPTPAPAPIPAPAPAIPPPTPPGNDLFPETTAPPQTGALAKVSAASDGVFEKFGQFFKRGRGRATKDGRPKVSDIPLGPVPGAIVPPPPGGPAPAGGPDNTIVIRACFERVGKAGAAFLDRILQNRALAASDGDKTFAAQVVAGATATPEEMSAFADLGVIALKELKLELRFLPIIAAGTVMAGGAVRYGLAFKEVNAALKEKQAKLNPQPAKP